MFEAAVACLVITALLEYLNHRLVGLPTTIGMLVGAMLLSLTLVALDWAGLGALHAYETEVLQSLDFSKLLLDGMLSMLLFAGALHIDLSLLRAYRWQVAALALVGTLVSTAIVGFGLFWLLPPLGLFLPLTWCLVFGALISPTDPIAVIGILKNAGVSQDLSVVVSGESLFNDGVGVVLFALLVGVASSEHTPTAAEATMLLLREAGGGILLGGLLGWMLFVLLRSIDNYKVEVLLTLAGVLGGYELAHQLHVSGPLAMVVTGVIIGNHGRALAMSDTTRHHVDLFWSLIDDILNALLFVLLGLEIIVVELNADVLVAVIVVPFLALLARVMAVGLPVATLRGWFKLPPHAWRILTWGGLRGGISVALALSLPLGGPRDLLLALTYSVVVFSILVQGLSMRTLVRRSMAQARRSLDPR